MSSHMIIHTQKGTACYDFTTLVFQQKEEKKITRGSSYLKCGLWLSGIGSNYRNAESQAPPRTADSETAF